MLPADSGGAIESWICETNWFYWYELTDAGSQPENTGEVAPKPAETPVPKEEAIPNQLKLQKKGAAPVAKPAEKPVT